MEENSKNLSYPNSYEKHSQTLRQGLASMLQTQGPYSLTWMQKGQFGKDPDFYVLESNKAF